MKNIAIVPNTQKKAWEINTRKIINILTAFDVNILLSKEFTEFFTDDGVIFMPEEDIKKCADMLFSLGGDGTLMRAAKYAAQCEIPILGINMGHLGYLVELELFECQEYLPLIFDGKYERDARMMLEVELERGGNIIASTSVLNDSFIAKGSCAKMIPLEIMINSQTMNKYVGDGVIIATPTGSTAYSLSAGGPVLEPGCENILVTPISPHTIASRPIVMSCKNCIEVKVLDITNKDANLICDGELFASLRTGDIIRIIKAKNPLVLIRAKNRGFYQILRDKLSERGI